MVRYTVEVDDLSPKKGVQVAKKRDQILSDPRERILEWWAVIGPDVDGLVALGWWRRHKILSRGSD